MGEDMGETHQDVMVVVMVMAMAKVVLCAGDGRDKDSTGLRFSHHFPRRFNVLSHSEIYSCEFISAVHKTSFTITNTIANHLQT